MSNPDLGRTPTAADPSPTTELEAARERVVRLLTDRYADDAITVEEFERRLDAMHAATSSTALMVMAQELERSAPPTVTAPAWAPPAAMAPSAMTQPIAPSYPAYHTQPSSPAAYGPELNMLAVMSSTRRTPRGAVPAQITASAVMGELIVDLRELDWMTDGTVQVTAIMGNVKVLLPPHVDADIDVSAFMASVNDRTSARYRERPGAMGAYGVPRARVRITGMALMADVTVRSA